MNKIIFSIGLICLSKLAVTTPIEVLKSEGCHEIMKDLLRSFIEQNPVLLSIYEDEAGVKINASDLSLCGSQDLDQGSTNLRRETRFCDRAGKILTVFTTGDSYCANEKVLGIKSLTAR